MVSFRSYGGRFVPNNEQESAAGSIYFPDSSILERVDKLVERTGISRNKVLVKIISDTLGNYEKNPALLIEAE